MDEDTDLIKQYVSGSEYAIEELVLKYQKQIYAFIYRMINDIEEAKDLTQQTFIRAAEGLKNFRGDSSFRTWLYQIAKNTSINKIRQGRPEETELEESIAGYEPGTLSLIINKERMEHIRKGLDRLPERQRLAIARALLRSPGLIIFDEATSSLDSITEKIITKTIKTIKKDRPDIIIVMVAHRLSTIRHSDSIYVLENGRVVEHGTHSSLLKNKGVYSRFWKEQVRK